MITGSESRAQVGKACREALDGNLVVGSFAAELAGESYPFSKAMCDIIFKWYSDEELGNKFVEWIQQNDKNTAKGAECMKRLSEFNPEDVKPGLRVQSSVTGHRGVVSAVANEMQLWKPDGPIEKAKCLKHEEYHSVWVTITWDEHDKASCQALCDLDQVEVVSEDQLDLLDKLYIFKYLTIGVNITLVNTAVELITQSISRIKLLQAREKAARINLEIAHDTIKKLQGPVK